MDGYRSQPSYDRSNDTRMYNPSSYPQETYLYNPQRSRSASRSITRSDGLPQPTQQPLNNALSNAFDKSDSARDVDPDLIAQITAEVKKSVLDEIRMSGIRATSQPAPQHPYPEHSPKLSASLPPRNIYTPPSPKQADLSSFCSASSDPLSREPVFDGADDTPTRGIKGLHPSTYLTKELPFDLH